jgi:hypothetical protein
MTQGAQTGLQRKILLRFTGYVPAAMGQVSHQYHLNTIHLSIE